MWNDSSLSLSSLVNRGFYIIHSKAKWSVYGDLPISKRVSPCITSQPAQQPAIQPASVLVLLPRLLSLSLSLPHSLPLSLSLLRFHWTTVWFLLLCALVMTIENWYNWFSKDMKRNFNVISGFFMCSHATVYKVIHAWMVRIMSE